MKFSKKILALLLSTVILTATVTACGSDPASSTAANSGSSGLSTSSTPAAPEGTVGSATPDLSPDVIDRQEANSDSVGWLQVPMTPIDEVVLWSDQDNEYYLRRNFDKQYEFNGVLYADYRDNFQPNMTREELSNNTVIYGHAMTDDPANASYDIKFGPLHSFRDIELASEIPYIYFGTDEETIAFEVFAVFTSNVYNPDMPYNSPKLTDDELYELIETEILPRSIYNYEDVTVEKGDKILTLSTCIYEMPDGTTLPYPNSLRYAVMARMVEPDAPLKETATITVNEDVIIDPDGKWAA